MKANSTAVLKDAPPEGRLESQTTSLQIWAEKYKRGVADGLAAEEASPDDTHRRVARALAENEGPVDGYLRFVFGRGRSQATDAESMFRWATQNGMVLAGRPQSALGTAIKATLINCFVQPIRDTSRGTLNGKPGIMPALEEAFETLRRGGGTGYNFSYLRPKGAKVASTNSTSSGPLSFMEVYGQNCAVVESAGQRRGAQMAVLNDHHPDVLSFIHSKDDVWTEEGQKSPLAKFNISVLVSDALIEAARLDQDWELWHEAEPNHLYHPDACRRDDGKWVYKVVSAKALVDEIVEAVYNGHGEPGVLFKDSINRLNPLNYAEEIDCSNPCAEQVLPDYGCCDLGSVNLTRLIRDPFTENARLDFSTLEKVAKILVRALDNVLDLTLWPLEQQREEAMAKRRIGVGFLGLGSALTMLGLRYDSDEGRAMGSAIAKSLATACYRASIELAKERGAFPLLDPGKHVEAFVIQNLPKDIRDGIRKYGLRNSHLLSIAPTGTIALAFADNASNGIEPPFSWFYNRKVVRQEGGREVVRVEDHAFRVWRHLGCPGADADAVEKAVVDEDYDWLCKLLPASFRSANDIRVSDHLAMMAAVQPYIDASISKTVNVPVEYPYEDFKGIYLEAHRMGLKSVAAFRPKPMGATVLVSNQRKGEDVPPESDDPDRRIRLGRPERLPTDAIIFPGRPHAPEGHRGRTWDVRGASTRFFMTVNITNEGHPFEVLVTGAEAPRASDVLAKLLSLDMHTSDIGFVCSKLDSLSRINGGEPVEVLVNGERRTAPSPFAAMAMLLRGYIETLGIAPALETGAVLEARLCKKEPKSIEGGAARAFDINNPVTGDDFTVFVKEYDIEGLGRWPLSIWLAGKYPPAWNGIAKILSLDMQVGDPAWIARKLRAMSNVPEHGGDFMAKVPGQEKQRTWPSTWAFVSAILLNRYMEIGVLNKAGFPAGKEEQVDDALQRIIHGGMPCPDCGNDTLIKRDGCEVCDTCGHLGACG